MSKRGFTFKSKKIEVAPELLRDVPVVETLDTKPSKIVTAARAMFAAPAAPAPLGAAAAALGAPKKKVAPLSAPPPAAPPPAAPPSAPPSVPIQEGLTGMTGPPAPKPFQFKRKPAPEPAPVPEEEEEEGFTDDVEEMAELIRAEEKADPYEDAAPAAYVPETRRGFAKFIRTNYDDFMLEATAAAKAVPPGEKYPYQKFVREYMREASPYRGILVYHGLGSGKTCTAIAASEALFSTANKKIIVMTPFSLRKNFLKEVSLCGFRHFRLQNYWVALPMSDPEAELFGRSVYGLSDTYFRGARNIWVPDFRKSPEESNYKELSAEDQTEIRKQILAILVWDPVKNPNGRIRFINYNGISALKLQEIACAKPNTFFDDAVIIVDEIHNLVRTMQGKIDPYLTELKGRKRLIPREDVTVGKWNPSLCLQGNRRYARGYLFYRLLLDAKNSKIVGLSGTPLINFPEELGILMNVLHGYLPTVTINIEEIGDKVRGDVTDLLVAHPFTDFVEVKQDASGRGTQILCTLLPFGVRKVAGGEGVERIPEGEARPPPEEVIAELRKAIEDVGFSLIAEPVSKALPLLPPTGEEFKNSFVLGDNSGLKNQIVLTKRITGLVSYYKGSREDLMPRVKVDEVVRVPMSNYSQKGYVAARQEEVMKEKKPKKGGEGFAAIWSEVYEVGTDAQSSNYKMASRQACNFTFPSEVQRPKPSRRLEQIGEAAAGDSGGDINDTAPDPAGVERDAEGFPELEGADEAEAARAEAAAVAEEDREALAAVFEAAPGPSEAAGSEAAAAEEGKEDQEGGGKEDEGAPLSDALDVSGASLNAPLNAPAVPAPAPAPAKPKPFTFKRAIAAAALSAASGPPPADCKAGQKPGESYRTAIERAKECLRTIARSHLVLGGADGLEVYSPKFAEMLKRIAAGAGSSLVYSQFLDMEGIGIFRICMDANGYAPIEIVKTATGPAYSKRTLESLKRGPGAQPRYMTFSGGEEEEIRRYALDVFNAKFDELPENLKTPLLDAGYTNNHKGEICRVFCITSAGAEGLSLKCVRAVHIMEPYWNDVRLKQVKGRAIRIGSHLELPEEDRDVSIYTYLTVFPTETQTLKTGENRIDETIRNADSVIRADAVKLGLPVPDGAASYVTTTDERLYLIADRKKTIMTKLESVMKSASIDCQLNIKQNRDGTFKCEVLDGKVGDFMYHPVLQTDINETSSAFNMSQMGGPAGPAAAPSVAPVAPQGPPALRQKYKGVVYRLKPTKDEAGATTGFEMYADDDKTMSRLLGTSGAKDGKPAPPIRLL